MASPATSHHAGISSLSSIAESERQSSDDIHLGDDGTEAGADGDDSDEDYGANAELERGAEIKSGFLIKKQERRKVSVTSLSLRYSLVSLTQTGVEEEVVCPPPAAHRVLQGQSSECFKTLQSIADDSQEYSLSRAIDLRQVHSVVPVHSENQKHPFAFAIVTSARTFMLEALSAEERNDWIRVINATRKRLSEKDEDDARRREHKGETRTNPVPVPAPQSLAPGAEVDTHQGTWTSTVSGVSAQTGMSVSPGTASGGYFPRGATGQPSSLGTSPNLPQQMGNLSLGRSPSTAAPPSAATVNRRLSNPIVSPTIPGLHPPPARTGLSREISQGSIELAAAAGPGASTLSPPGQGNNYLVSSDEDEPYFSDPRQGWPDSSAAPVTTTETATAPAPSDVDPNKIILATYLMKKSRKTTRKLWRKRWFYLTSSSITYTKSHMDSRPLTTIPIHAVLDVFSVESDDSDEDDDASVASEKKPHRHTSLRSSGKKDASITPGTEQHKIRIVTNKRRYDLCAPSEEEEIKWLAAIRALINRERERQVPASNGAPGGSNEQRTTPTKQQQQQLNIPTISQQPPTPSSLPPQSPATQMPGSPTKGASDYMEAGAQAAAQQGGAQQGGAQQGGSTPRFVPTHGRTRSATQTAKNAVADVVRRFHTETAH